MTSPIVIFFVPSPTRLHQRDVMASVERIMGAHYDVDLHGHITLPCGYELHQDGARHWNITSPAGISKRLETIDAVNAALTYVRRLGVTYAA